MLRHISKLIFQALTLASIAGLFAALGVAYWKWPASLQDSVVFVDWKNLGSPRSPLSVDPDTGHLNIVVPATTSEQSAAVPLNLPKNPDGSSGPWKVRMEMQLKGGPVRFGIQRADDSLVIEKNVEPDGNPQLVEFQIPRTDNLGRIVVRSDSPAGDRPMISIHYLEFASM